jgi:hypothetical protein
VDAAPIPLGPTLKFGYHIFCSYIGALNGIHVHTSKYWAYGSIWGYIHLYMLLHMSAYVSICGPMDNTNIYGSNNINDMRIKKEIPVDQDIIDYVNEKYPGVPFTKWADMAFRAKMDDDNEVDRVLTKDVIVNLLNTMGKQIHDMHKRLK